MISRQTVMGLRTSVVWGVTLHGLVACCKYYGTAYWSNHEGLSSFTEECGTDSLSQNVSSQL